MWIIVCAVVCTLCTLLSVIIVVLIIEVVRQHRQLSGIIASMMKEKHYDGCSRSRICAMSLEEKPVSSPVPSSGIQSDCNTSDVPRRSSRFLFWRKKSSVSHSMAYTFIENLRKIIKFGLDDATISKQLKEVEVRDEVWPLVPEESSSPYANGIK